MQFGINKHDEIKRSSQLRTLLKRVVENRTWKKFSSALPTELTSQLGAGQCVGSE